VTVQTARCGAAPGASEDAQSAPSACGLLLALGRLPPARGADRAPAAREPDAAAPRWVASAAA